MPPFSQTHRNLSPSLRVLSYGKLFVNLNNKRRSDGGGWGTRAPERDWKAWGFHMWMVQCLHWEFQGTRAGRSLLSGVNELSGEVYARFP